MVGHFPEVASETSLPPQEVAISIGAYLADPGELLYAYPPEKGGGCRRWRLEKKRRVSIGKNGQLVGSDVLVAGTSSPMRARRQVQLLRRPARQIFDTLKIMVGQSLRQSFHDEQLQVTLIRRT